MLLVFYGNIWSDELVEDVVGGEDYDVGLKGWVGVYVCWDGCVG